MKTILDAYLDGSLQLSKQDETKYNAADHPDYHRGESLMGKKAPKVALIYSVHRVDRKTRLAECESRDGWGGLHHEVFPAHTLVIYKPTERK